MTVRKTVAFPCPCCGFLVFDQPSGSYAICHVCGWEDDPVQLRNPSSQVGANRKSLWDGQQSILKSLPLEVREHNGFSRDPDWRPLSEHECSPSENTPHTSLEYFEASAQDSPSYYWRVLGPTD